MPCPENHPPPQAKLQTASAQRPCYITRLKTGVILEEVDSCGWMMPLQVAKEGGAGNAGDGAPACQADRFLRYRR